MPYYHRGRDTQYRSASVLLVIEAVYVPVMDTACGSYLIETFGLLEKDVAGKAVSDHHIGTVSSVTTTSARSVVKRLSGSMLPMKR